MTPDFQREYQVRLPLPLAQLYSRAYNDKSPRARHDNTYYLLEAFIKLATAPLIVGYLADVEQGAKRSPRIDRLLTQLALPSLGQWVNMLRELARWFGARPDAASHPLGQMWKELDEKKRDRPGLLALFRRLKNGPDGQPAGDESCSLLQVIEALVPYRNGVLGHGGPRFESFYEREMGPLLFPAANEFLAEGTLHLLGPKESRLVYIAEVRVVAEDRVELGVRELVGLRGERAAPLMLTATQAAGMLPGRVAVIWPGRPEPLLLYPLLIFREGELADELLYLNRDRDGKQAEYLSYTTGRTERERSTIGGLAALLSRVTNRPISEADVERLAEQSRTEAAPEGVAEAPQLAGQRRGDFEILAEIGRGGMGVVFLARQLSLGRLVALKMLPTELAGDDVALARFRREMRAIGRCEHPHIVKVLTSGTFPDGQMYYAMEYVPGADLDRVWRELAANTSGTATKVGGTTWAKAVLTASEKRRTELEQQLSGHGSRVVSEKQSAAETATGNAKAPAVLLPALPSLPDADEQLSDYARRVTMLVRDAALALQAVHDQHIVHRDVKPANLMLSPDGARVVLMDFGLAKGLGDSLTRTNSAGFVGSWRYAAPEQLAAATLTIGPAADVRGLGVTLWELLTRRRLFAEAEDEKQLAQMIHERDVPRLRTVDSRLDRDLEAIVARATERRVTDRIGSAGRMAEYLQLYLEGKPLPIRPPGLSELLSRWVREHRGMVATAATGLAAVILVVVFAFLSINAAKNKALEAENKALKLAAEKTELAAEKISLATEKSNLATEKTQLAATNLELAQKETVARQKVQSQAAELTRNLAASLFERGCSEYVQGRTPQAMAMLGRAFETADAKDPLRDSIRRMLGHWLDTMPVYLPHHEAVSAIAFSPDGATALSGSQDATARLWNAHTGKLLAGPLAHEWPLNAVAFNYTGTKVITVDGDPIDGTDGGVHVWEASTGKKLGVVDHGGQVLAVATSPKDNTVLTGIYPFLDTKPAAWLMPPGAPRFELAAGDKYISAVAISPNGATAVTGSREKVARLWDVKTGQPMGAPMKHEGSVNAVAFSPSGALALTASGDKTARLWDAHSGQPVGEPMQHEGGVWVAAFSPNGLLVLTGSSDQKVRLWNGKDGKPVGPPLPTSGLVRAVAFSPDGARFAAAADNTVQVREVRGAHVLVASLEHEGVVRSNLAFSPSGARLLTGCDDGWARIWNVGLSDKIGRPIVHSELTAPPAGALSLEWIESIAFNGDGSTLLTTASRDNGARLWNARTGEPACPPLTHRESVKAAAFSPAGDRVVTGGLDLSSLEGMAQLWDARTGKAVGPPLKAGKGIVALSFSPDGKTIATAHHDKTVYFWNGSTGQQLGEPLRFEKEVASVLYSPVGSTLFIGGFGVGQFYDVATRQPQSGPIYQVPINAVRFNPNGLSVLMHPGIGEAIQREGYIYVLDAKQGKLAAKIEVEGNVSAAEFSPDGSLIAGGGGPRLGGAGFARLWNAKNGQAIGVPMLHDGGVNSLAFSPSGSTLVTGNSGGARFWDVHTCQPLGPRIAADLSVNSISFAPDGSAVALGGWREKLPVGYVCRVPQPVPAELVTLVVAAYSGLRLSAAGHIERLSDGEISKAWAGLESTGAEWLAARTKLDAAREDQWHRERADEAESHDDGYAAVFHLDWLLRLNPADKELVTRRERAAAKKDQAAPAP